MRIAWLVLVVSTTLRALHAQNDWPIYGHDPGGERYSPLKQINTSTVTKLAPAWSFPMRKEGQALRNSQSIPIVVNGVLYVGYSFKHVAALEPETGKVLWEFAARGSNQATTELRSLAYWPGDKQTPPQILFGNGYDGELYSLNAKTGKPNPGFGNEGIVNLKTLEVMNGFPNLLYGISSAPFVYKNLVITGSRVVDETGSRGPAGDVRAWDLHAGKLVWTFHTVPRPGEMGHESWLGDSWKNIARRQHVELL